MIRLLAYAQSSDSNTVTLTSILGGVAIVVVVAVLAGIPLIIARRRRGSRPQFLTVVVVLWALLSAGSLLRVGVAQLDWSKEYTMRIESGYFDPQDTGDAPKLPWGAWAGLAAGYVILLGWSSRRAQR